MEKQGILTEISPWGTGFIDESETHRAFGFHHSMLVNFKKEGDTPWPHFLEGRSVSFTETNGRVTAVQVKADASAVATFRAAAGA